MRKQLLKAYVFALSCILAVTVLTPFSASAYSPAVKDINITVDLQEDGSANVIEIWDVTVAEGTEWYLIQNNLDSMEIKNFSVTDENGTVFENIGKWDVNKSISEKAGKCGIVETSTGLELCWGVGSYGDHTYTVSYLMTGMVKSYDDYDVIYHRYINDKLTSAPESISVTLSKEGTPFEEKNVKMWAYGYYGDIAFSDGTIKAKSSQKLSRNSHVTLLLQFEKGVFSPSASVGEDFEYVKNIADEGSDYNHYNSKPMPLWQKILIGIFILALLGLVILLSILAYRKTNRYYYKKNFGFKGVNNKSYLDRIGYHRDLPFDGEISSVAWAMTELGAMIKDGDIVGAYLLKWHNQGFIRIVNSEKKGMLSTKKQVSIEFYGDRFQSFNFAESEFFRLMWKASGRDGILQEHELKRWASTNYTKLEAAVSSIKAKGAEMISDKNMAERKKGNILSGLSYRFNREGFTEAEHTLGFRRYLQNFTIINERKAVEVELWNEYLILASVFGIADKVAKEFQNIYPDFFEVNHMSNTDLIFTIYAINSITRSYNSGISEGHTRDSGGGGSSSFGGGGGGFSGGGSGGGSR